MRADMGLGEAATVQPLAKRCTISTRVCGVVRAFLWVSIRGSEQSLRVWQPQPPTLVPEGQPP